MLFRAGLLSVVLAAGSCGAALAAEPAEAAKNTTLHTCAEVRGASPELLQRSPLVELEATITFVEPGASLLFVHDGTAGIYVHSSEPLTRLAAGTRMHLRGTARPGRFTPVVFADALEARGEAALPAAEATTVSRINAGALDSQWVEVSGIVRRDGPSWVHRVLEVYDGDEPVYVQLKDSGQIGTNSLFDARITVRGVVANQISEATRPPGFTLYVPQAGLLQVVGPPPEDPFTVPLMPANRVSTWPGVERLGHAVRVRGVATFQLPGQWLALHDGEHPIVVESMATNQVAPGTEIEAVGFVRTTSNGTKLDNATWRATGNRAKEVSPAAVRNGSDLAAAAAGRFVEVTGVLLGLAGNEAVLQCERSLLPVRVRDSSPASWEVGAQYRITGTIWAGATNQPGSGRSLWVADASAAKLLHGPIETAPGWITARDFLWLGVFAAVIAGWWWQQRQQRRILEELEATLAFNRAQLVRAENEQARIARDLHDGVIQSIYAVGMRIEECRKLTDTSPIAAREKLATTSEVLNHVIRDVRGFLTGLEPGSIQGRELKTALKSMLLSLGDEAADRIALEIDPDAAATLTSKEATELFHICKEALSNSLRHGRATRIEIGLRQTAHGCRLRIADNGRGFDPEAVPAGSRGLQNIRTRARNLGAELQQRTAPGTGTELVLLLPKG